jgi:hypothetical protein
MASPERSTTTDTLTNDDSPRPYPRLTEAQKARVLAELAQEYALDNLRPIDQIRIATGTPEERDDATNAELPTTP